MQGTKTAWFPIMARANSSKDPPDIRDPHFQRCRVPLIWWPWWAFNPADFYMNSVLQMERLQREGIIDRGIQFVPVLDGFEVCCLPHHYKNLMVSFCQINRWPFYQGMQLIEEEDQI